MMPGLEVVIDRCRDRRYQDRPLTLIRGLMIHRVGLDLKTNVTLGTDAVAISDTFTGKDARWPDVARATGYQNPYTFYIGGNRGHADDDGRVWQALELTELGHHARIHSKRYLAIALIGDFRVEPPSAKQWGAAVSLCADLSLLLGLRSARTVGHGEVEGAHGGEKAPGRSAACPGGLLSLGAFRGKLSEVMDKRVRQDAIDRLEFQGVRLP